MKKKLNVGDQVYSFENTYALYKVTLVQTIRSGDLPVSDGSQYSDIRMALLYPKSEGVWFHCKICDHTGHRHKTVRECLMCDLGL